MRSNKNNLPWGLILASGMKTFVASMLFFMLCGSAHWGMFERKETSYADAFKRAYSIRKNADSQSMDGMGLTTVVFSFMIGAVAMLNKKNFACEIARDLDNMGPGLLHYTYGRNLDMLSCVFADLGSYVALCEPVSRITRDVIKKRASQDSQYFTDALQNYDNISPEIFCDVMIGHLKNHPKDYQKLLAADGVDAEIKEYFGKIFGQSQQKQK